MSLFRSRKKRLHWTDLMDERTYLVTKIFSDNVKTGAVIPQDWFILSVTLRRGGGFNIVYTKEFRALKKPHNVSS